MKSVCHITTVHPARDIRILYKECASLARNGYDVTLIVVNGPSFDESGVRVVGVPCSYKGRISRFFRASKEAFRKAVSLDTDIYHFHDPEFLPYAAKLIRRGKKVIYDVHEDLPRQMLHKYWIPKIFRRVAAALTGKLENRYAARMSCIITVTDHIRDRFAAFHPGVFVVRNYPFLQEKVSVSSMKKERGLLYVGSITPERGITELTRAMELVRNDVVLTLAGNFAREQYRRELSGFGGWKRVDAIGFADRSKVRELMERSFAGLVTLHPIPNYLEALPVKMFEYMSFGLPVIASRFTAWKEIIEGNRCGLCVNPLNPAEIAAAIDLLCDDPELAANMGENGQKAVEEKYNWNMEEQKLIEAYKSLFNA